MRIYDYQQAFGSADKTSGAMRRAVEDWFSLYYGKAGPGEDSCQRIAYTVVNKLVKTVFSEYKVTAEDPLLRKLLDGMDKLKNEALQLALVGGECYIKPCPEKAGFSFTLIPRDRVLIFGRDARGVPVDMGTAEKSVL